MKRIDSYFLFTILGLLSTFHLIGQRTYNHKVDPAILERLETQNEFDFIILMKEQGDVAWAKKLSTKSQKGNYVYHALKAKAKKSQQPIQDWLSNKQISYRSFFLVNSLAISGGDIELINQIAVRPDVSKIIYDPWVQQPPMIKPNQSLKNNLEWGIEKIRADLVWQMGITGKGVIVAGQDTGFDWDHKALIQSYAGNKENETDHNYSWHDAIHEISPLNNDATNNPSNNPCGVDSKEPCDDNGHGTFTLGVMTGDDQEGAQIGAAPGAKWIACRNMERGAGKPSTYIECFEWCIAPTDLNGESPQPRTRPSRHQ